MIPDWSLSIIEANQSLSDAQYALLHKDPTGACMAAIRALHANSKLLLWIAEELERQAVKESQ